MIGTVLPAALLEPRQRLDRQQVGVVVLAGERAFDARVGVGHRHEAQFLDQRLALAAVAAGGLPCARVYLSKRVSSTYWSGRRSLNL